MNITLIHQRLAEAVNNAQLTGNNLRVIATAYMPKKPEPPHFYPFNWRATYDRTHGGMVELTETWHLVLAMGDDEAAHYEATGLAGTGEGTIRAAIIAARGGPGEDALGGAVDDIVLRSASGPNPVSVGDTHYLVIEFVLYMTGD